MYKKDLVLNNLQWLICYKIKPKQTEILRNVQYFFIIIAPRFTLSRSGSANKVPIYRWNKSVQSFTKENYL